MSAGEDRIGSDAVTPAGIEFTEAGVPWSARYGDLYHPAEGAIGQSRHVFLEGNALPERWQGRQRFVIVETGFGTGLNFLATWARWREDAPREARLHYVSAERHPFVAADLARLHGRWPQFAPFSARLRRAWPLPLPGFHRLCFDDERVALTLLFGDATRMLARLSAHADAFYLDGFSPARNPQMWCEPLCLELARLAAPGASLATWSVAAEVRANLARVGFALEKRPGFGGKREMLVGRYPGEPEPAPERERRVLIVGAGMAGSCCADRLAARGWEVELVERHARPAREASGNATGVLLPLVNLADTPAARLSRAALLYASRHLDALCEAGLLELWRRSGVLQLAREDLDPQRHERILERHGFCPGFARNVDIAEASDLAGWRVAAPGWWFPAAGWLAPREACEANLRRHAGRIHARFGQQVAGLACVGGRWSACDAGGKPIASAPVAVLANAMDSARMAPGCALPLTAARGQVSHLPQNEARPLALPVCRRGYITPAAAGMHGVGATFDFDEERSPRASDHRINLERLEAMLPGFSQGVDPDRLDGRVSFRATTPDRLPIAGALPGLATAGGGAQPAQVLSGLGARGLVWAALLAELLASRLDREPLPVEAGLAAAIEPARFLRRRPQES
ncbi:MAG: bifunctional tRNA (5-methylaminomethyl-2-thiouridine)(34)-methyltransferase MnmD/FAD-dependent 5-carboxymethylaminomethyl-2-thiouridine(34) oxidoreductase MnmC [Rhodocyclales bacterium CG_4_9_14_3_um_filter_68_10]|nr:MAG: bifunctional tRNA (5-methylaminomethyl-2-thiouridine)(34)-methyltransferase MnmD/FAD-dependent 5-carboxymethylaminomethyl-2-thiouridine(34) oxidoreductase MnmC [Rhodocyclales bacterium CG_4_9_14_3_um_filter_68_10]